MFFSSGFQRATAFLQSARSDRPDFNVALAKGTSFGGVRISVPSEAVSGEIDQGGGVVWRARDGKNYQTRRAPSPFASPAAS